MFLKHASSSKRELIDDKDDEDLTPAQNHKKARTASTVGASSQPTNKVMPAHINFPPKKAGNIRFATWNICSYAASQKKGFKYYVEAEDADILLLTETKVNDPPANPSLKQQYPFAYWSMSNKKSYAGVALLSKFEPLSVHKSLPGHPDPDAVKGRIITLEFEHTYVIGTYVTNAGTELKTLEAKNEWNLHFTKYIRELNEKKPVIWFGDLNVAPTEMDLTNAKKNWNKTAGYTKAETEAFREILSPSGNDDQFVDIWREFHPNDKHYSYFSYRFNCRSKGLGWRLDMFIISKRLQDRIVMSEIRDEIYGASDHCPVVMELEGQL